MVKYGSNFMYNIFTFIKPAFALIKKKGNMKGAF